MSLLKMLADSGGDRDGIERLASGLNMERDKAGSLAELLTPAIASAARKRADAGGVGNVLDELRGQTSAMYFDEPEAAAAPEARETGQNFLEQILGSREATRELATEAASRTGATTNEVEDFLPALAAMLKGGMQKQTPDSSIDGMMSALSGGGTGGGAGGGLMGMIGGLLGGGGKTAGAGAGGLDLSSITQMLDADGDGSAMDDILERIMK